MGSKRQKVSNYNKEVRELIRECDEFITSIESDLAQARRKLKGSKCNKRSKYNKEVRQLIRECEDLINDLELDISIENTSKRVNKCKNNAVNKVFRAECAELVQGIYLDVLTLKLKNPFAQKKMLKRCDELLKEFENDMHIGKTEHRLQMENLLYKCDVLLDDINVEIARTSQRQKRRNKMSKIKDEVLNIISINARGVAKKKKKH